MRIKSFCLPAVFIVFLFLTLTSIQKVKAESIPLSSINCSSVSNDEFHSLRPYPKNIRCTSNTSDYASYCGGDLTLTDSIEVQYPGDGGECTTSGNKVICNYSTHVSKSVTINLSGAELPIMGNTEDVVNSQKDSDNSDFDDVAKMNEYVSWYLGGVTNKKEYPDKSDDVSIVNYSGPLAKLLPQEIQFLERFKQIAQVGKTRHDQVVVCTEGLDGNTPTDCDSGNKMRLSDWDGDLSIIRDIQNAGISLVGFFVKAIPWVGQSSIEDAINNNKAWPYRTPPLMSGVDPNGEPFNDMTYQKAYNEWRGKSCIMISFPKLLVCLEDYLVPNKYADMYSYIPMSSTEDIKGEIVIDNKPTSVSSNTGATRLTNVTFTNASGTGKASSTLFFPHMEEADELSSTLQKTYVPKDVDSAGNPTNISSDTSCIDVEVRSNAGDNLFASSIVGTLSYDADFSCSFDLITTEVNLACLKRCVSDSSDPSTCHNHCQETTPTQTCTKTNYVKLSTSSNTPKVDDIWSRLVAGPMSVFKRIFPKTNTEGSVGKIMDIAGSTNITYSGTSVGESSTDLKIPHIGGVYEYFLKGIQTALRPQGYGESVTFAGNDETLKKETCGTMPNLPTTSSECSLTLDMINGITIPPALKNIIEAAGQAYKVPSNLILGVMYSEGTFEQGKYDWTEENAKNWSLSCNNVPNCNSNTFPTQGVVPYFESDWKAVKNGVNIVDTTRNPNPCNLMDAIFALAKDLSINKYGSKNFAGKNCFGIPLNSGTAQANSCNWNDGDYETAIRIWEFGTVYTDTITCSTLENSCFLGGGLATACPNGDNCETTENRYSQPSHNACIWDIAHGY